MIRAYSELYLADARRSLANCFDYAANTMHIPLCDFYMMFAGSDIAPRFEKGDPFIVSGKSGIELALLIIGKNTGKIVYTPRILTNGKSREYWAGWALAFYQWYSNISFSRINDAVPITVILDMYDKYHEMDIMQFTDRMNELRAGNRLGCYLKKYREQKGFSQSELAHLTNIPLRTLQHYEQGTKSLERANVSYLVALSKALDCEISELL